MYQGTTSQVAEKLVSAVVLKGHGLSRADKANRMKRALAPEGRFLSGFAIPLGFFRSLFSRAAPGGEKGLGFSPCHDNPRSLRQSREHAQFVAHFLLYRQNQYGKTPRRPSTRNSEK
jgi:hypothetical protein